MDSIQAVREAVEKLSTDEKIDDGEYLSLMNHLKSLYEKLDRSNRSEHNNTENSHIMIVRHNERVMEEKENETMLLDLFQYPHSYVGNRLLKLVYDGVMLYTDENNPFALNPLVDVEKKHIIYMVSLSWRHLEAREIFLSNKVVRKIILENMIEKKKLFMIPKFSCETEEDWARNLYLCDLPFTNTTRVVVSRGKIKDYKEIDESILKKNHPITLSLKFKDKSVMELNLYTDKIKLGSVSRVTYNIYRIMLNIIITERWVEKSITTLLQQLIYSCTDREGELSNFPRWNTVPSLCVSGITGKTRAKSRMYEDYQYKLYTISYKAKYE